MVWRKVRLTGSRFIAVFAGSRCGRDYLPCSLCSKLWLLPLPTRAFSSIRTIRFSHLSLWSRVDRSSNLVLHVLFHTNHYSVFRWHKLNNGHGKQFCNPDFGTTPFSNQCRFGGSSRSCWSDYYHSMDWNSCTSVVVG